jgi:hypothetical protein
VATFSEHEIQRGLQKLGELAQARGIEIHLIPGDELTAQYAFLDLWETPYGTD